MLPFGEMVENLRKISWICNLFAVPKADAVVRRWAAVSGQVRKQLAMRPVVHHSKMSAVGHFGFGARLVG
jgi:hypothetical protein